ncbi:uncharacterized protein LOC142588113 isoform X2 [Dermacentor variabilis]|uniref:uncharacterized protein LOC142588113 isoform X2 n=1 Tax=Dermacentor variabilis TaxID=34621 RepID=UPI003F5BE501
MHEACQFNTMRRRLAATVIVSAAVLWMTATPGLADGWWWQHCLPVRKIRVMLACSGIEFVPRTAWGARPPKGWEKLKVQPVPRLFVHHTEGPECFDYQSCSERMRHWQNFHMDTRGQDPRRLHRARSPRRQLQGMSGRRPVRLHISVEALRRQSEQLHLRDAWSHRTERAPLSRTRRKYWSHNENTSPTNMPFL